VRFVGEVRRNLPVGIEAAQTRWVHGIDAVSCMLPQYARELRHVSTDLWGGLHMHLQIALSERMLRSSLIAFMIESECGRKSEEVYGFGVRCAYRDRAVESVASVSCNAKMLIFGAEKSFGWAKTEGLLRLSCLQDSHRPPILLHRPRHPLG